MRIRILCFRDAGYRNVLCNMTMIKKQHIITKIGHGSQIVCDENIGQAKLFFQVAQQVHDLYLGVRIERRNCLVKQNDFRLAGHRPRNADTLQLSPGEFMRVAVRIGGIETDKL